MNVNSIKHYFEQREAAGTYAGVALITQGEQTLFQGSYGYANREWHIPNALDVRYDTASITKLFTAVAVLQLIEQGRLSFDTSAIDFLGLRGTAISLEVTVRHLLTHTSGIGDDADEEAGEEYADLWIERPNYGVRQTVDFLPQFIHKPPNFAPGEGCRYCNCSYVLLGLLVEKVTGVAYRDYVRRHVFAAAGMTHSDFLAMDIANPRTATGYEPIQDDAGSITGWRKNIYSYPPIGSPDGGANVTAGDLDRFLRAIHAGKLLSPEMTAAFFTPQVHYRQHDGWKMEYGYGLWFYVEPDGHVVCYEKEGINAGVSAVVRYFPAQDINVVLLSNLSTGVWEPIWRIHEAILAE